jgi:hypothetical protein
MSSYKNLNNLSLIELLNEIPDENVEKMINNSLKMHILEVYFKSRDYNYSESLKIKYLMLFNRLKSSNVVDKIYNHYGLAFDIFNPIVVDYEVEGGNIYAIETDYRIEDLSLEEILGLRAISCTDKYKPIDYLSMCLSYLYGREEILALKREALNRMLNIN